MNLNGGWQLFSTATISRRRVGRALYIFTCAFLSLVILTGTVFAQRKARFLPRVAPETTVTRLPPLLPDQFVRAVFPDLTAQLARVAETSTTGVLVETLDGRAVKELSTSRLFNPASATKLATALIALQNLGPRHRFATVLWTNGRFDAQTGTIDGDLFISGRDPALRDEHVVMIAHQLNLLGIRSVSGDLYVPSGFLLNYDSSALRTGGRFYDTLDATLRPPAADSAWRQLSATTAGISNARPSVAVMGDVFVGNVTPGARSLLTHHSSSLVDILKVLLCYSNNFMTDRLGEALGGPQGIEKSLIKRLGIAPGEIKIATASGLGANRLTPRAMMKIYRALLAELTKNKLSASDILPVAGIDAGTLEKRFTGWPSRGSVIAKTGTLPRTDGGVSALVGQMRTRNGETLLFVIFNQRGNVRRFRETQDMLLTALQHQRGGPAPFSYQPLQLTWRLTQTQLVPSKRIDSAEYEPTMAN